MQGWNDPIGSIFRQPFRPTDPRRWYRPCNQSAEVELYTIIGGEHAWPGGEAVSAEVGQPTTELSATPLMWAFFIKHALP